jgi:hypothetical protein
MLYDNGFSAEEIDQFRHSIRGNLVEQMTMVVVAMERFGVHFQERSLEVLYYIKNFCLFSI